VKMRNGDVVLIGLPILAGVMLLLFRLNELRFYSLESPFMWSFLAFGISVGIFIRSLGESGKKPSILGVPVQ
jgi:hypothetical protein